MNLTDQVTSDISMLELQGWDNPEQYAEEIEAVEDSALMDRVLAQNGYPVTRDYGELNWLAEALGISLDIALPIGGSNGK